MLGLMNIQHVHNLVMNILRYFNARLNEYTEDIGFLF